MKKTTPLSLILAGGLLIGGGSLFFGTRLFVNHQDRLYANLTATANCQNEVIAPFIQNNGLAHARPKPEQIANFAAFLHAQASAGTISNEAAEAILQKISSYQVGMPVYTSRGWMLPLVAKGY